MTQKQESTEIENEFNKNENDNTIDNNNKKKINKKKYFKKYVSRIIRGQEKFKQNIRFSETIIVSITHLNLKLYDLKSLSLVL